MARYSERQEGIIIVSSGLITLGEERVERAKIMHRYLDGLTELERPRGYHSWDHVLDVLSAVLQAVWGGAIIGNSGLTQAVAALYHDCVYQPGAPSGENEKASAKIMVAEANYYLGSEIIEGAQELILATAKHGKLERFVDREIAIFMDADIAGLACPYPRFVEQNEEVDQEFRAVYSPEQVAKGRRAFLESMLAKQTIYLSDYFGSRLEWRARDNIQRLLSEMP